MMRRLGPGYVVWDKAAEIEFVAPGRGDVRATFELPPTRWWPRCGRRTDRAEKVLQWYPVDIVGRDGTVVARDAQS